MYEPTNRSENFVTFGRKTRRTLMKIMKTTSLKLFQPATLAALAVITLWGVSIRPAQAGYTVTLEEVGTDVVATGSGAIDLTGLSLFTTEISGGPVIDPTAGYNPPYQNHLIYTGTSSSVDWYLL